jgi:5-methylcytosine-specific restriction endonuclease McrA
MRKIIKPTISSTKVYADCIGVIRNLSLKNRLAACSPLILQAEREFDLKITRGRTYTITRETIINGNVTATELKNVYNSQMVGNPVGRIYYNMLILSAPQGLCPLCAHRDVSTLDHYLPKAEYPRLSTVPINLIPACKDCNTGKLTTYPISPETEPLHPYYDDIEQDLWLEMSVFRTHPISVEFTVNGPSTWNKLLSDRVQNHFTSYGLGKLYAIQAARELSNVKSQLINIFDSGNAESGVTTFLKDAAATRMIVNKNSWQSAMYKGLSNNSWFCKTGFRQIGT